MFTFYVDEIECFVLLFMKSQTNIQQIVGILQFTQY